MDQYGFKNCLESGNAFKKRNIECVQTMLFKLQFICHLSVLLIQIGSGMMFTKAMLFSVPSQLRSVDWPPPRAAPKSGKCASHSDPIMDATGVSFPHPSKVESKEGTEYIEEEFATWHSGSQPFLFMLFHVSWIS